MSKASWSKAAVSTCPTLPYSPLSRFWLLRLFRVAQHHKLDIHPAALQAVTRHLKLVKALINDPEANRLFLEMLTAQEDPETTLRRLNEAGVFGRFIPDFGRVVAQMQYDMYHSYTVDEHTIRAIGILNRIEAGALKDELPAASAVVHKLLSRRVLYLAVLLHDIAKGRGGDHSVLGAEVAMKLCPRLGLEQDETETVAWLVRYHLLMSSTAFKRDIDDPSTIETFSAAVQSIERLRLLLVLTAADIRAVGPKTWNAWKATLLRELYYRTEERLSGGLITEGREARVKAAQDALRPLLLEWSEADFAEYAARAPASYWLGFSPETHARHARLVREAASAVAPVVLETRVYRERAVTEITIVALDHPGLFARIAGALALSGADIVDARIFTLTNALALDTFTIPSSRRQGVRSLRPLGQACRQCGTGAGRRDPARAGIAPAATATTEPHARDVGYSARAHRQQGERHPYGHRGDRPRSPWIPLSGHQRADGPESPDLDRQDLHLRRQRGRRLLCKGPVRPEGRQGSAIGADPRGAYGGGGRRIGTSSACGELTDLDSAAASSRIAKPCKGVPDAQEFRIPHRGHSSACTARPGPVSQPSTSLQPQSVDWTTREGCRGRFVRVPDRPGRHSISRRCTPISITFRNIGKSAHNFTSSEFFSAVILRPETPGAAAAQKGQIELTPAASTTVELVPVKAGRCPYVCTHPFHEVFGMSGVAVIH